MFPLNLPWGRARNRNLSTFTVTSRSVSNHAFTFFPRSVRRARSPQHWVISCQSQTKFPDDDVMTQVHSFQDHRWRFPQLPPTDNSAVFLVPIPAFLCAFTLRRCVSSFHRRHTITNTVESTEDTELKYQCDPCANSTSKIASQHSASRLSPLGVYIL